MYSVSIITAGTGVDQLAERTIQSSCHANTVAFSKTMYLIASCQLMTETGSRLTGCASEFNKSTSLMAVFILVKLPHNYNIDFTREQVKFFARCLLISSKAVYSLHPSFEQTV
jgi:hypothetical protein